MNQQIQFSVPVRIVAPDNKCGGGPLTLDHALRIRSARHWLQLGEPDEPLRELEALPSGAWQHPLAVQLREAALQFGGERV